MRRVARTHLVALPENVATGGAYIPIPADFLVVLDVTDGDIVEVDVFDGGIVITKHVEGDVVAPYATAVDDPATQADDDYFHTGARYPGQ